MLKELESLFQNIKSLDKKAVTIFLSIAVLQTVSYYYTSRRFFRANFYYELLDSEFNPRLLEFIYWFLTDSITLFIIPLLIILFLFKEKPREYGVSIGDYKIGIRLVLIFSAIMIPLIWFVSSNSEFAVKYPHLQQAKNDWGIFLIYEIGILIYLFAWEFIWRGYMLFGLEKKFGYYSIFIQMIPFVMLHNGKPDLETFSAILGGLALGVLAFRTRSMVYGWLLHFIIMFSIDTFSVMRHKAAEYGSGIFSLGNVFGKLF